MAASEPQSPTVDTRTDTCDKHGPFISKHWLRYWTGCPACEGAQQAHEAEERRRAEEQRRAEYDIRRIRGAGLVGRFEHATFDSFKATTKEQRAVATACRDFAQQMTRTSAAGLFLLGPPGTGKTHLASAIVRHVLLSRREFTHKGQVHMADGIAEILTARDLVRKLRATWKRDSEDSEEDVIRFYGDDMDLLVLDEVGASFGTEAEQVQLLDVIDFRYRLQRPTVIVSNLTAADLKLAIGDRAFDRLREGAKVLLCTWPSHRGTAP